MRRKLFQPLVFIFVSSIFSYIIMFLVFPDLFVKKDISFIRFADAAHNYFGVFTMISNIFHGGINLWNNYDLMPLAYYYLIGGITSFSNLIFVLIYTVISSLSQFPAILYHDLYSVFFLFPTVIILTCGNYLLLSRFTKNRIVLFISLVLAASVYVPHFYSGFSSSSLYSFFPLLLHFVLNVFEKRRLSDLLLAFLIFTVTSSMNAELSLGYFYQGLHLFIISTIIWFVIFYKLKGKSLLNLLRNIKISITKIQILQIILTIIICLLLIGPWIYLIKNNYKDYDVAHETSRFANYNPLDFGRYFKRPSQAAPAREFLPRIINFADNHWEYSYLFLGFGTVLFSIIALILAKDKRKYIFATTIFFFWWLNSTRKMFGWSAPIHWLNSITNPLNLIVRSFHMTGSFLLPFILVPLVTIGFQTLADLSQRQIEEKERRKLILIVLIEVIYIILVIPYITRIVSIYLVIGFLISLSIILILYKNIFLGKSRYYAILILSLVLFSLDAAGTSKYLKQISDRMKIIPQKIVNLKEPQILDFQNPKVLPFRNYYYAGSESQKVSGYLQVDQVNNEGLFYRYTDFQKFFKPADNIHPRHISFSRIASDPVLQNYLGRDERMIYQADLAVKEEEGRLLRILERGWDRRVVMIDRQPLAGVNFNQDLPEILLTETHNETKTEFQTISVNLTDAKSISKDNLVYYIIDLPIDFPLYSTGGVYTKDANLIEVAAGTKKFSSTQGGLGSSYTFDVQNFATGKLTLSVPSDFNNQTNVTLKYPKSYSANISSIWKNEPDNLGFDYQTEKDGWLVIHFPYDKKWKLTVDDQLQEFYRVNYSFIGIPIKAGSHKILLSYWPNIWLRVAIGTSLLLIILVPVVVILIAIKNHHEDY